MDYVVLLSYLFKLVSNYETWEGVSSEMYCFYCCIFCSCGVFMLSWAKLSRSYKLYICPKFVS